jgi:hypothetical protein
MMELTAIPTMLKNHLTQVDGGTTASYIYDPNGTRDARRLNRNEHRYVPF